MRVVIYDDEEFEPITVVDLAGVTDRDIGRQRRWRVALPLKRIPVSWQPPVGPLDMKTEIPTVELEFEMLVRNHPVNGEQVRWMCFTRAADLAMQLVPDWLPGQRAAVQALQSENAQLAQWLSHAILHR